jgi:hypothetical protein
LDPPSYPDYYKALLHQRRRKIVKAIAQVGGVAKFSTIAKSSGIKDNVLLHHLNVLISHGVVEQIITDGPYRLKYMTPLNFIFNPSSVQRDLTVYVGLLGEKMSRSEAETVVALDLLKKEGILTGLFYVVSSREAASSWDDLNLPINWILCEKDSITDIDRIMKKVEINIRDLIREHFVIMDCTSFNKPATIAMYELAQRYLIPLIYIYEPQRKLKWLVSMQSILGRFNT